ncbi:hypothetical protein [Actinokineospora fastidiosa]|uniref:Uncharacterized protein n=1 Tax=Actinokineospora fastidiosa TaxID=1816 RepID=A0A918GS81_9PSEU|nr:hypothetical protein [Actinokineospora fastidiosa]GGS54397.1 hypothetical protein GCM10010171_56910 [Actinokineospora fastidiosa]
MELSKVCELAEKLVEELVEEFRSQGWELDVIEDDEYVAFKRPHTQGIFVKVGVTIVQYDSALSLSTSLSVGHPLVSELTARFFGFESGADQVGASLSDLIRSAGVAGGGDLVISSNDEIGPAIARLLTEIELRGVPFWAGYTSIEDLVAEMKLNAKTNLELATLAVAHGITDELVEASSVLARLDRMVETEPEGVAAQTRSFVDGFRVYFAKAAGRES